MTPRTPHLIDEAPHADGRRQRGRSSRAKIVNALLELVGGGDVAPSAARVAEVAGVGLRSVFRHFDDMDTLYREMGQAIEARVTPILAQPPAGDTWQDKVRDIAARRAQVFEAIMPYRISGNLRRFESDFLMQGYRAMLRLEAELLATHLPPAIRDDLTGARGLNIILGFQTWRSLRHDQQLSVTEARAVVRRLLDDVLARLPQT